MKKSILFLASAALLLAGCAKVADENKEVVPETKDHSYIIKATVDQSDTRVSVDDQNSYLWQLDDRVDILMSDGTYRYGFVEEPNSSTADIYVPNEDEDAHIGRYGYYPSSEDRDEYSSNYFVLNDQLDYRSEETFMPMLGTISSQEAVFRSVGGVLEVPILHFPSDGCLLEVSVNGKRVTGAFLIEEVNGTKQINAVDIAGYDSIIIRYFGSTSGPIIDNPDGPFGPDGPDGGEGGVGGDITMFYIPLPCGTYSEMIFSIYDSLEPTESALIFSKTARINGLEVARNDIITTPVLEVTIEPNYPASIVLSDVPNGYSLDENDVLNVDQFNMNDDGSSSVPIYLYATIEGTRDDELDGEGTVSCQLVPTDPNLESRTPDFWSSDNSVGITIPTDVPGEFKLVVTYTPDDPDQSPVISAESFTIKVHEATPLPESLSKAKWDLYSYSSWFNQYRFKNPLDNTYETTYLKTYKASLLETLPVNAFRSSFNTISESFEEFACFSSITSIPDNAFNACVDMTGISIPSGVTSIGNSAFAACRALDGIELPEGVTSIGNSAFNECNSLSSLHLPSGVTSIGKNTFNSCYNLESINLDNVLSIGVSAFENCDNLTEVVIGNASIGNKAFNECEKLQSVTIGTLNSNGTASIGSEAFASSESLSDVTLVSVSSIGDFAFFFCSLNSITLSDNLTTIGESAFWGSGLRTITIPASVQSIGNYAFAFCYSLEYVEFMRSIPPTIDDVASCFYFAEDPVPNFKIYVPADAVSTYQNTWPAVADRIQAKPEN